MSCLIPAWEDGELRALDKLDVHKRGLKHKGNLGFRDRGRPRAAATPGDHKYHNARLVDQIPLPARIRELG